MRYQGSVITEKALAHGDIVAICDVDRQVAEKAREQFGGKAELYEDYRKLLERPDIDVVMIGTPDHWHTAMVIDACRAGKDVYCEKPLTLTIDEGKLLRRVVRRDGPRRAGRHLAAQRSRLSPGLRDGPRRAASASCRRCTVVLGKNDTGGPFAVESPPPHFNWNLWQGQTPDVPYIKERCALHVSLVVRVLRRPDDRLGRASRRHRPVGASAQNDPGRSRSTAGPRFPTCPTATTWRPIFASQLRYADGVELEVLDDGRNGIMFEGRRGPHLRQPRHAVRQAGRRA